MWLRCTLSLLYLLQLVVLSGMVAAYIYDNSFARPPPQLAPTPTAKYPRKPLARPQPKIFWTKPAMRPIPLRYLMDNMDKVTSPLELARLFTDSSIDDHQLSRWMSRTVRSASRVGTEGLKLKREPHQKRGKQTFAPDSSYSVREESRSRERRARGQDVVIADGGLIENVDVEKPVENEEDYFYEYQADEYSDNQLETFEAALYHKYEMATCSTTSCRDPKPFVQHVSDPQNRHLIFIPDCTLLYRCLNSSGCCRDLNRECAPKKMSIVDKSFLVVDLVYSGGDLVTFNPGMTKTISFVNHTECECKEKPRRPRCTKRCPKPFRLTREGATCKCDCFQTAYEDSWQCEGVKVGVKPLAHDELVCIKKNNCYKPVCTEGEFDVRRGYCPLSDDYALPVFFFDNPEDRRFYRKHLYNFDFSQSIPTTARPLTSTASQKRSGNPNPGAHFGSKIINKQSLETGVFPNASKTKPSLPQIFDGNLDSLETVNENETMGLQHFSNSSVDLMKNLTNVFDNDTFSDDKNVSDYKTFTSIEAEELAFFSNNLTESQMETDEVTPGVSEISDSPTPFLNKSTPYNNDSDVPSRQEYDDQNLFQVENVFNSSDLSYNVTNLTASADPLTTQNEQTDDMSMLYSEPNDQPSLLDMAGDDKSMQDVPANQFHHRKDKSRNSGKLSRKLSEKLTDKRRDLISKTVADSSLFSSLISISPQETLPPSSNPKRSKTSSKPLLKFKKPSTGSKTVSGDEREPVNLKNRPVLDGLYDYDYSPLEGSGENFEDNFR